MLSASIRGVLLRGRPLEGIHVAIKGLPAPLCSVGSDSERPDMRCVSRHNPVCMDIQPLDANVVLWALGVPSLEKTVADCTKALILSSQAAKLFH